jgi:excisionase family DNA binding protein
VDGLKTKIDGLLDISEAAKILGIKERCLKDHCRAGKISYSKPNYRTWRFWPSDVQEYLDRVTHRRRSVYS